MTTFTARIAGVATLALAVLPAAALTTAAHAGSYVPAKVAMADLNLASAAGKQAFVQRADAAARRFCSNETSLSGLSACRAGVKSEIDEKAGSEIRLASRN
jgi:UrcA family protein